MGNKVIKFGKSEKITANANIPSKDISKVKEVYNDLSMIGKPNIKNKMPRITDQKYKLFCTLAQEHPNATKATELVLTEKDREEILLLYGIDYNQFRIDYDMYLRLGPWATDTNINVRAVQGSLRNIFTWIPGERILNPEFGSKIRKLLYEGLTDYNVEQIVSEIRHCVSEWEPRVQIQNVINIGTVDDTEDNTVHLEVIYTIPGLSEEQYHYSLYGGH